MQVYMSKQCSDVGGGLTDDGDDDDDDDDDDDGADCDYTDVVMTLITVS
jgi:hypothetical protein